MDAGCFRPEAATGPHISTMLKSVIPKMLHRPRKMNTARHMSKQQYDASNEQLLKHTAVLKANPSTLRMYRSVVWGATDRNEQ
eukprot:1138823-Pelagomonas_calceolata.AAC.2